MSRWALTTVAFCGAALLAACGSGGSSAAVVPSPAPSVLLPVLPGPARAFAGMRTIEVQGTPIPGYPGAGSYTVAEVQQDVAPGSGAPAGAAIDRHATRTFTGTPPTGGVYLQSQTIDEFFSVGTSGLAFVGTKSVTVGRDLDAEQHSAPGLQFTDTRTLVTNYSADAVIVPSTPVVAQSAFPLGSTSRLTERSVSATGITAKMLDRSRTTNADASFDELGGPGEFDSHAIHQHADGSAASHDQVPGFSLRDVSVSAPAGSRLVVTTQTQGRDIGNPPVIMNSYTTPIWYEPGGLGSATLYENANSTPESLLCGRPPNTTVFRLNLARGVVDVTSGIVFVENDVNDVDAAGNTLCRLTSDAISTFDVTTGAFSGITVDTTTVHYTNVATSSRAATPSRIKRSAPTGTR